MKSHLNDHLFKKDPLNSIISFAHVWFESYESVFPIRPRIKSVKEFIGNKDIIRDKPMRNESTLGRENDLVKNPFELISQHLSNDFIDNITKTNRSEIPKFTRMLYLRNESYKGMVNGC